MSTTVHVFTHAEIAQAEADRVLHVKRARMSEKIIDALRNGWTSGRDGIRPDTRQVMAWSDEERAEALAWATQKRGWNNPPPEVPGFIRVAVEQQERWSLLANIADELQVRKFKAGVRRPKRKGKGSAKYAWELKVTEAEVAAEVQRRATAGEMI